MKRLVTSIGILAFVFSCYATLAQSAEENMMKYWRHRMRLTGDGTLENPGFLYRAADPFEEGSYLPAEAVLPYANCSTNFFGGNNCGGCDMDVFGSSCGILKVGGDATIYLGFYIGVLATEYRLLKDHQRFADAQATGQELWAALKAYERLDLNAETFYGESAALDGFFARDDMSSDYPGLPLPGGGTRFPGISCATTNFSCEQAEWTCGNKHRTVYHGGDSSRNVPTADQIHGLFVGFALVSRCLSDGELVVNGEDVRTMAQTYTHLITKWQSKGFWSIIDFPLSILAVGFTPCIVSPFSWWIGKNPDGKGLIGDLSWGWQYSYPMAEAGNYITGNDPNKNFYPDYNDLHPILLYNPISMFSYSPFPFVPCIPWLGFSGFHGAIHWNAVKKAIEDSLVLAWQDLDSILYFNVNNDVTLYQAMSIAAISNNWTLPEFQGKVLKYHLYFFDLLRAYLHGTSILSGNKTGADYLIDVAPCDRFCHCNPNQCPRGPGQNTAGDYCDSLIWDCPNTGTNEWTSPNRWSHAFKANLVNKGDVTPDGDYNGLDFLILYNVYHLLYPGELPHDYGKSYVNTRSVSNTYPKVKITQAFGIPIYQTCTYCHNAPREIWSFDDMNITADFLGPDVYNFYAEVVVRAGTEINVLPGADFENGSEANLFIQPFQCGLSPINFFKNENHRSTDSAKNSANENPVYIEDEIKVFPNPNSGALQIEFTCRNNDLVKISVMDLQGRILSILHDGESRQDGMYRQHYDITHLAPGAYILDARAGEKRSVFKIIKL